MDVNIDRQDIRLVSKALKADLIKTGNYVKNFKIKFQTIFLN
jgi:hypothetical protein